MRIALAAVATLFTLVSWPAQAAPQPDAKLFKCNEIRITRDSYNNRMRFCLHSRNQLSAIGRIDEYTPLELMLALTHAENQNIDVQRITFHSPGGNMRAGMMLGDVIRSNRLNTHVGKGSKCASACALAFYGGVSRKVTHDGKIGNHQFSASDRTVAGIETTQDTIAWISKYHTSMNVSPLAVTSALSARADQIYWYSPQERREWGIVTKR